LRRNIDNFEVKLVDFDAILTFTKFFFNLHTLGHGTEDAMLAIQPGGLDGAQEELGSVGVWAGVGHGKNSGAGVLEGEVLVGELFTVDGLTAGAVAAGEVTTLTHEIVNDTMEGGALEVKGLAALAHALLAGAEAAEIFGGLGDHVRAEGHFDAAGGLTTDGHVKENLMFACKNEKVNAKTCDIRNFDTL
jgi:hypothetical protein